MVHVPSCTSDGSGGGLQLSWPSLSYYSTKLKMLLPKITYKGHCCTPGPAGCTLKWFLPQDLVSPDLTEGALFRALISFLTAHPCKSCMFHWCHDQTREYIYVPVSITVCDYQVFRSPFTALVGVGSGLGKWIRPRWLRSIPCPSMDSESV